MSERRHTVRFAIRPRGRLSVPAAVVLVLLAYVVRSVTRGFDFTPDIPGDLVVLGAAGILLGLVFGSRTWAGSQPEQDVPAEEDERHDQT